MRVCVCLSSVCCVCVCVCVCVCCVCVCVCVQVRISRLDGRGGLLAYRVLVVAHKRSSVVRAAVLRARGHRSAVVFTGKDLILAPAQVRSSVVDTAGAARNGWSGWASLHEEESSNATPGRARTGQSGSRRSRRPRRASRPQSPCRTWPWCPSRNQRRPCSRAGNTQHGSTQPS